MARKHRLFITFGILLTVFVVNGLSVADNYSIQMVSVVNGGGQANNSSYYPAVSGDGRFVVFGSGATNLVLNDTNGYGDVFVRDLLTSETSRASVASDGTQANYISDSSPSLSRDGRFVAFSSGAASLVMNDSNGLEDIFVRDRLNHSTVRVSVSTGGVQTDFNSNFPTISADGRSVVFYSRATTLVVGDTNADWDTFVHDLVTSDTTRVSVSSAGAQGNGSSNDDMPASINSDGRYVAFASTASNLVPGDTNNTTDVFVRDRQTNTTSRVSVSSTGVQGNNLSHFTTISADGRFVAFVSPATNLVPNDSNNAWDVFEHDLVTGETIRVSVSSGGAQPGACNIRPAISSDGRFVVFCGGNGLVTNDPNSSIADVFVHDRITGTTALVSLSSTGQGGNAASGSNYLTFPAISLDGRFVLFGSSASNLVPNDINNRDDLFLALNTLSVPVDPVNLAPALDYFTALPLTLSWSRVSWAQAYKIQVNNSTNFNGSLSYSNVVPADTLSVLIGDLPTGIYYWRVQAQNNSGGWGAWSAVESFRLTVPTG